MIENHPQWDGFLLDLSEPGYGDEQAAYDRVKTAWLRQVDSGQQSGAVLHNAAVFFASRDPDFAVELLERAIRLEPDVPFHVVGLGILYGRAQVGLRKNTAFATRASSALLSTADWLIVAGALNEITHLTMVQGDLGKLLSARLTELAGNRNPVDLLKDLPYSSPRDHDHPCAPLPLLHKCTDAQAR